MSPADSSRDVADALDAAVVHELGDLGPITSTDVWYGTSVDDDALSAPAVFVDLGDGPHPDRAATGPVALGDAGPAEDRRAGREVGPGHELHEVFDGRLGIVDQVHRRVDDLA